MYMRDMYRVAVATDVRCTTRTAQLNSCHLRNVYNSFATAVDSIHVCEKGKND